jgi:hypothetical protein
VNPFSVQLPVHKLQSPDVSSVSHIPVLPCPVCHVLFAPIFPVLPVPVIISTNFAIGDGSTLVPGWGENILNC